MRGLSRLFWYLVYFFQAETSALRKEALAAAKEYYSIRPVRNAKNPYPHPIEYQRRLDETTAFQRAYINEVCSRVAKEKLAAKYEIQNKTTKQSRSLKWQRRNQLHLSNTYNTRITSAKN